MFPWQNVVLPFIYFKVRLVLSCMISSYFLYINCYIWFAKIFSHSMDCFSFNCFLCCAEAFKFVIVTSVFCFFCLYCLCFGVTFKISLPRLMLRNFYPVFSSRSYGIRFNICHWCQVNIFCVCYKIVVHFQCPACVDLVFSTPLIRDHPFSTGCSWLPFQIFWAYLDDILLGSERITCRKARGLQREEIDSKCQTFFISLLGSRRKQC